MKTFFLSVTLLTFTYGAFAQGTLNFANGAAGVNAPFTNAATGTLISAADGIFYAGLYVGNVGDPGSALQPNGGAPVQIGTSTAGYFFGGGRIITGFAAGAVIQVQVRAWNASYWGSDFPTGLNPSIRNGDGYATLPPISVSLGGGAIPTPNLVGLSPGTIGLVPEPSSLALLSLGIVALVMIRSRTFTRGSIRQD